MKTLNRMCHNQPVAKLRNRGLSLLDFHPHLHSSFRENPVDSILQTFFALDSSAFPPKEPASDSPAQLHRVPTNVQTF